MYNKYPYTDFSELNLDWFLEQFKLLVEEWKSTEEKWAEMQQNFQTLESTVQTFTTFVENYFENLDVQQEINNKLDAMALDGTLSDLLAPFVTTELPSVVQNQLPGEVTTQLSGVVQNQLPGVVADQIDAAVAPGIPGAVTDWLDDNVNPVGSAVMIDTTLSIAGAAADAKVVGDRFAADEEAIEKLDHFTNFNFGPGTAIDIPAGLWPDNEFEIYKTVDGYIPNKLPGDYWTLTGTDWYVSWNDGADTNTGVDSDHPLKSVRRALALASAGDIIHIAEGIYDRVSGLPTSISKSVRMVGYGKVYFTAGDNTDNLTYTSEGDNTWSCSRSSAYNVIDYSSGTPKELSKATSISDCKLTANSFYIDSSIVYVHTIDNREPDADIYILVGVSPNTLNTGITLYTQNIHFDGGTEAFKSTGGILLAENCVFEFGRANGMALQGCLSYLYGCMVKHNTRDGFNYHADSSDNPCQAIEVNCRGYYNGIFDVNSNNNGSTIHGGSSIIRIGCNYWYNKGPNIADVNSNTKSYNITCKCSNSAGETGYQADFQADGGSIMYLLDCQASDSETSVKVSNTSEMYVNAMIYNGAKDVRDGCIYAPIV